MITLAINDQLTPDLQRRLARLGNLRPLVAALGKGLEADLREHFLAKNKTPNRRGFPRSNFWAQIRDATALTVITPISATVAIADPRINSHAYGGTITPKQAKNLAIPADPAAAGTWPSMAKWQGRLRPLFGRGRKVIGLIEAQYTPVRADLQGRFGIDRAATAAGRGQGKVMFWLKPSVTIPRDPTALPERATLEAAAGNRARAWLDNLGGSNV